MADPADPFGTAALRASVLAGWRDSPTRFREDANAEDDLRVGGYRDRLLVELAQNAADAAVLASAEGVLWLRVADSAEGPELRIANTGAALDADGVAALASLRASAKRAGHQVGRFGVGFAAVLAATDAPRVVSTSGGVRFSAERTRKAADRDGEVPVLRLVWPVAEDEDPVPDGFATDVRLPLRSDIDAAALLDESAAQAADLLLALPGLTELRVGERSWRRVDHDATVDIHGPSGVGRWLLHRCQGVLTAEQTALLGVESRARPEWSVCWAVPVDGDGVPLPVDESEVLRAPTPTDERLSLPARLFATVPLEPSRRRLLPGPAAEAVLAAAAREYPTLVVRLAAEHRTALVPRPGFPRSDVDGTLRDAVLTELTMAAWLPSAGSDVRAPAGSVVLAAPDAGLAAALAEVVPGLLAWWLAQPRHAGALATLGVPRLAAERVVEAVSGVDRPPGWWTELYAALGRWLAEDSGIAEALGALPVPLADGRTAIGPRDVLLPSAELGSTAELAELTGEVIGLRLAHPDVVHPLLTRLGARAADAEDLLDSPPIREAVERSLADAESGADLTTLTNTVLTLVRSSAARPGERSWLSALALSDVDGEPRRADELVLPDAPLLAVLAADAVGPDGPLGVLAAEFADRWPAEVLRAIGVVDSFAVVADESPSGPDHDLADEDEWWSWTARPQRSPHPPTLIGVRDLDLVDPDRWPDAIRLLAGSPETARALADPAGYPAWWLARYARLDGLPPREWRLAGATELAGLYDPVSDKLGTDGLGLDQRVLAMVGVRSRLAVANADDARDLLDRLGDPKREMPVGAALRAHAALAEALRAGTIEPDEVEAPERVRTLAGVAVSAEQAAVLDRPWLLGLLADDQVVAANPDPAADSVADPAAQSDVERLADLLNVALASEISADAVIESTGEPMDWSALPAVRLACELLGAAPPAGSVVLHEELVVRGDGQSRRVRWWIDGDGQPHAEDSAEGLARALAWSLGRWSDRWTFAGLIAEPDASALLG
ncbi:MAG TPA: hypothetical protein VG317_14160 [Pseudonocardiaceae bacterium]|nr:hypothetical protein [Pseudonocardiaceae bacterium]